MDKKTSVLFIAGAGRSGSTLLERMLGQIDGFVTIGELRHFWRQDLVGDICGCGQPFQYCPLWTAVFAEVFGQPPNFADLRILRNCVDRIRYIPQMLWASPSSTYAANKNDYADIIFAIYRAVLKISGGSVIVDSSKDVSMLYLLSTIPEIDLHVLHLVRDSRAVAFSWQRKRIESSQASQKKYMPVYKTRKAVWSWLYRNTLTELVQRRVQSYSRIYYEKMVLNPVDTLRNICEQVGFSNVEPDFFSNEGVDLRFDSHTVSGNPMRFQKGRIQLRLDNEWQTQMTSHDRRTVSLFTWPLLKRYGYKI